MPIKVEYSVPGRSGYVDLKADEKFGLYFYLGGAAEFALLGLPNGGEAQIDLSVSSISNLKQYGSSPILTGKVPIHPGEMPLVYRFDKDTFVKVTPT
jgi:hypothetical protein